MNQILIEACVTTFPDGSNTARLRKAIIDEKGHPKAKYFLTTYGEWREVHIGECVPDECILKSSIHEGEKEYV